jgi:transcriptional regulator with XRE-family HTH domain
MRERINRVISHEGLSPSKFADILGVQRSSVSHILSGRNNPGLDFLNKVLTQFPNISGDWLITGQGNMLKKPSNPFKMPSLFEKSQSSSSNENKTAEINSAESKADIGQVSPQVPNLDKVIKDQMLEAMTVNSKSIERIIVFYNDKSFREYHPE